MAPLEWLLRFFFFKLSKSRLAPTAESNCRSDFGGLQKNVNENFNDKNRQQMALLDSMESAWLMNFRGKLRAFDVFFSPIYFRA